MLRPWLSRHWCLPREASGAFVADMEEILAVYQRPPDPARPLVCLDEAAKALVADVYPVLPPRPAQGATAEQPARPAGVRRHDHTYRRQGSASLFLWCAPHLGQRAVVVSAQRRREEWAAVVRHLVDDVFPAAERIVLVVDNLNTHSRGALYHTFPPAEAERIWQRLEVHYTPVHASWLNMAERELSALARQCLARRIPDRATLAQEVAARATARNTQAVTIDWQFTTADARTRLKRLYPDIRQDTS